MIHQHINDSKILNKPIAKCTIKLEPIDIGAHPAVPNQIGRIL